MAQSTRQTGHDAFAFERSIYCIIIVLGGTFSWLGRAACFLVILVFVDLCGVALCITILTFYLVVAIS